MTAISLYKYTMVSRNKVNFIERKKKRKKNAWKFNIYDIAEMKSKLYIQIESVWKQIQKKEFIRKNM